MPPGLLGRNVEDKDMEAKGLTESNMEEKTLKAAFKINVENKQSKMDNNPRNPVSKDSEVKKASTLVFLSPLTLNCITNNYDLGLPNKGFKPLYSSSMASKSLKPALKSIVEHKHLEIVGLLKSIKEEKLFASTSKISLERKPMGDGFGIDTLKRTLKFKLFVSEGLRFITKYMPFELSSNNRVKHKPLGAVFESNIEYTPLTSMDLYESNVQCHMKCVIDKNGVYKHWGPLFNTSSNMENSVALKPMVNVFEINSKYEPKYVECHSVVPVLNRNVGYNPLEAISNVMNNSLKLRPESNTLVQSSAPVCLSNVDMLCNPLRHVSESNVEDISKSAFENNEEFKPQEQFALANVENELWDDIFLDNEESKPLETESKLIKKYKSLRPSTLTDKHMEDIPLDLKDNALCANPFKGPPHGDPNLRRASKMLLKHCTSLKPGDKICSFCRMDIYSNSPSYRRRSKAVKALTAACPSKSVAKANEEIKPSRKELSKEFLDRVYMFPIPAKKVKCICKKCETCLSKHKKLTAVNK